MAYNDVLHCGEYVTINEGLESYYRAFKTVSGFGVLIRGVYAPQCYEITRPDDVEYMGINASLINDPIRS